MLAAVVLLLAGAAVLLVGAEAAVRGAGKLALARAVSPFALAAVVFGIDLEGLGAAVVAAGKGQGSIAAGEVFGTIVFLLSAAFGVALLVSRAPVEAPSATMVLLPAGALVTGAVALADRVVTRADGLALVALYAVYVAAVVHEGRAARAAAQRIEREAAAGRFPAWAELVAGLGLVYVGAAALVDGGVRVLERTALSAGFVGAALLGALVSADEVLLELLPIRRGQPELATGNLFGTVAAFATGVLGLTALVAPLPVDGAAASAFVAAAALYTVVAVVFLALGRAWRGTGLVVLAGYGAWLVFAVGT